jgi:hypothetical protein
VESVNSLIEFLLDLAEWLPADARGGTRSGSDSLIR